MSLPDETAGGIETHPTPPDTDQTELPALGQRVEQREASRDRTILVALALAVVLLHILTNSQYGFHRDELLTFDNAHHLAWGYVVYPPLTPFLGRVELELFGNSLRGFRFFVALAQGLVVLLAGLAARELGGKREAQLVAALAVAVAGHSLFSGAFMSYSSFDYLWWVLVAYLVIRLLKSDDPRWWVAIGAALGLGMMTKYTMGLLVLGVVGGVLLTPARRYLKSPWLWCGVALAILIVLPNLVWQVQHDFVSREFLKNIHNRDVRLGSTDYFLPNQLWKCASPVAVPLWCAGLWFLFAVPEGKRYRMLGWMYVIPLAVLFALRGRDYYLASAYPILIAVGTVRGEQWFGTLRAGAAASVRQTVWISLATAGLSTTAVTLPMAPINSSWWRFADQVIGGNFNSQVGWPDMVRIVAGIRDSLPAEERSRVSILAGDDSEVGAVALYGSLYSLPRAISGSNSNWYRGYGDPPPEVVIAVGNDPKVLFDNFESCTVAGHLTNPWGVRNNVFVDYSDVYVCRHLRSPWPEFWKHFRYYG
ncbi:MAG TPA: glycosyltransferase family 39 protein [Terriglobales bacterium]|nr:glycosyltransferase family 39 protein [Terriglobales bacterium]